MLRHLRASALITRRVCGLEAKPGIGREPDFLENLGHAINSHGQNSRALDRVRIQGRRVRSLVKTTADERAGGTRAREAGIRCWQKKFDGRRVYPYGKIGGLGEKSDMTHSSKRQEKQRCRYETRDCEFWNGHTGRGQEYRVSGWRSL